VAVKAGADCRGRFVAYDGKASSAGVPDVVEGCANHSATDGAPPADAIAM